LKLIGIGSAMDLFGQVVTVGYRGLEVWRGARHHMRGVYQTPDHDSFVRSSLCFAFGTRKNLLGRNFVLIHL
jgi:hypothetical protein